MIYLRCLLVMLVAAAIFCSDRIVLAQGPPINTDTPIMLGLQGRGVHTFGKVIRKTTLLKDGEKIADAIDREVTVWVTPLAVPYNFTDKFQVGGIFPFLNVNLDTRSQNFSSSGLSDIRFFAKYLLYQYDRKNKTIRVASKVGIKLPTGDEKKAPALGTGSTDYFVSTVAGWIESRVGIYLEGIYAMNTSKGAVNFGNSISYNFAFGFRVLPVVYETYPAPQLNAYLEINGTTTAKNAVNGVTDENSGGTTIFLSPGFQYVGGRRWLMETSFQYPIVDEPSGIQLGTSWTASLGIRLLLY